MKKLVFAITLFAALTGCSSKKDSVNLGYTVVKQEAYGGAETEKNVLVNSRRELVALYALINELQLPKVDFEKHSVVAVFMGQKSTGGYSITITDVSIAANTAEITVAKTSPTGMATMALTAPYCIAVIPKVEKIIVK
ncbi:MAG: protease complex subunit PrcB family protein [Bacteroidia bacterium]